MREKISEALTSARKIASEKFHSEKGLTPQDIYNELEPNMKRKLTIARVGQLLATNSFPDVKSIPSDNGSYKFEEVEDEMRKRYPDVDFITKSSPSSHKIEPSNSKKSTKHSVPIIEKRERSERKRTQKVVFDPSDEYAVKKRTKPKSPEPKVEESTECYICGNDIKSQGKEGLIKCEGCPSRVHKSCAVTGSESFWRCDACNICAACNTKNALKMEFFVVCKACSKPYHIKCANLRKLKKDWTCSQCCPDEKKSKSPVEIKSEPASPSSSHSSQEPMEKKVRTSGRRRESHKKIKKEETNGSCETNLFDMDEEIPDCTNWTPHQVHAYLLIYVPLQDAQVFLDQEVDGKVLMLLTRSDVLTGFNLKMGPALKVYSIVKRLQEKTSDIRICWN